MKRAVTVLALTLILSTIHSQADAAFRCPNGNLVDTGDSIAIVASKCDPPASKSTTSVPVETDYGRVRYDEIQEWVYTAGSTLMHILTFRNGVLQSINTGGFTR